MTIDRRTFLAGAPPRCRRAGRGNVYTEKITKPPEYEEQHRFHDRWMERLKTITWPPTSCGSGLVTHGEPPGDDVLTAIRTNRKFMSGALAR